MEIPSDMTPSEPFAVVGIGASAGGLAATTEVLRQLGSEPGVAVIVIHHLDPTHESSLAEIFSKATTLPVEVASEGVRVEKNHVYVLPPNASLTIGRRFLHLTARSAPGQLHLPIDECFESLAADLDSHAIGVLLSGTGQDGTQGIVAIKAGGGATIVQDESAAYPGMPKSAIATGCVDSVLPPDAIGREIVRLGAERRASVLPVTAEDEQMLREILLTLRRASGIDFTTYKPATIRRRVKRRLLLHRLSGLAAYLDLLREDPVELQALSEDVLIHVTSFFREPKAFAALEANVFPKLIEGRPRDLPIRVWVPGCSTGEEVYSLAMTLFETLDRFERPDTPIKLFGTDVSDAIINKARTGRYADRIENEVSEARLRRFFIKAPEGYQIGQQIRDVCVFARHDVTRDPPFSKMDLISCRNVMIYLSPALQDRILPVFHYALNEPGFLLLGSSETHRSFSGFAAVDSRQKIYARTSVAPRITYDFGEPRFTAPPSPHAFQPQQASGTVDVQREADRLVLAEFAPPGVVITDDLAILQFRGQTGPYLEPTPGVATLDLMRMAREELRLPLRQAIDEARLQKKPIRKDGHFGSGAERRAFHIQAIPFSTPPSQQRFFVVLFEDNATPAPPPTVNLAKPSAQDGSAELDQIQAELASTRSYLQSVIEQVEASNEELRAANEEIVSSNEELRSTNEELQTAKEELQATNEELQTVNDEMADRNAVTKRLNDDLLNILSSVAIPIVILGRDSRIRRFTPAAAKVLHLVGTDVGRPLGDIKPLIVAPHLDRMIAEVLQELTPRESTVVDEAGRWYQLNVRPYMTLDNRIDGTVVTAVDIDSLKKAEALVDDARAYAESIVDTVSECLVVLDAQHRIRSTNRAFRQTFRVVVADVVGEPFDDIRNGEWDIPDLQRRLEALTVDAPLQDFRIEKEFHEIGHRVFLLNARRVERPGNEPRLVLLALQDVTDKERAERELRETDIEFREMLLTATEGILLADEEGRIVFANRAVSDMFGYGPEELLALPVDALLPETVRDKHARQRADFGALPAPRRMAPSRQLQGVRKDGSPIYLEVSLGSMRRGNGILAAAFVTDITARLEVEKQIRGYQEKLQQLAFDAALTEEKERRVIAADLHDRIGQGLALAQIKLSAARATVTGPLRTELDTAIELIVQSIADTRTLTFELSPPVLYELGLEAALAWLCEDFEKRHGIHIEIHDDGNTKPLDEGTAALMFRAVRELFHNVLKHAQTPNATLSLERKDDRFGLVVEDQGTGFDVTTVSLPRISGGFGLFSVREQIGRLGGTVEVESAPAKGTRITLSVPLRTNDPPPPANPSSPSSPAD